MKIYQLHEYKGEWEDFSDYIIGSYLRKERAEEEKAKAEAEENESREQSKKCYYCPFLDEDCSIIDKLLLEYSDYCSQADLIETDYGIDCLNSYSYWDEATFDIKEVEVEE